MMHFDLFQWEDYEEFPCIFESMGRTLMRFLGTSCQLNRPDGDCCQERRKPACLHCWLETVPKPAAVQSAKKRKKIPRATKTGLINAMVAPAVVRTFSAARHLYSWCLGPLYICHDHQHEKLEHYAKGNLKITRH
ncbi:uncharacterized protein J5F26_001730 [Ciconia maguari]